MRTPQFSAKFKAGVKYLRHKNGVVHPYNPILANDPDFTLVQFSKDTEIVPKPVGYTPPEPVEEANKEPEKPRVTTVDTTELAGSIDKELLNPALPDAATKAAAKGNVAAQLISGLDVGGE